MQQPPYKDKMGRWRTQSLFYEFYLNNEDYPPVFTLKEFDHEGLPSIRQLFLSYEDPTGYLFSKNVLGSYEHWKKLMELDWFRTHVQDWLVELEVKQQANALRKIKTISEGDGNVAFQAAKFLAEQGWKSKRGRPSKQEIEQAKKIAAGVESAVENDLQRIRVVK